MLDEKKNQEIMDKVTKVCLCKGISRATIKRAIREGAITVQKVNYKVGSGCGGCKGRRCGEKIKDLIESYKQEEWI